MGKHTHTHTLMCSLAFISRLRVVCLLVSGPKGTRDFKRSKHSRRFARREGERGRERETERDVSKGDESVPAITTHLHENNLM